MVEEILSLIDLYTWSICDRVICFPLKLIVSLSIFLLASLLFGLFLILNSTIFSYKLIADIPGIVITSATRKERAFNVVFANGHGLKFIECSSGPYYLGTAFLIKRKITEAVMSDYLFTTDACWSILH